LNEKTDDRSIIIRCKSGEIQAYNILVKRYMQRAYFTALGLVGNHESALDLSQDAFVRAYKAIHKIDEDRQFFTYYYRILRNLCLNFIRDKKRHARSFSELSEGQVLNITATEPDPETVLERKEIREKVWDAIQNLSPDHREIIVLKEFKEYTYEEIAELLDIPVGTVMSRLYHARKSLKHKLEGVVL
jgi:RNA polymerase sigma-70 factor (ECF subfamily)